MTTAAAPTPTASTAAKNAWYRRFGSLSGRTLGILLALVIVVAAATRSTLSVDWSADRRFTLSDRLVELVKQQSEAVELVGIWSVDNQEALAPIDGVLKRAGELNPLVTYRKIDPELQKPLLAQFSKDHEEALANTIYVCRGKRVFAIPITGGTRFQLQRQLGGALLTVAEENPPLAIIMQGHGDLRSQGGNENGGDLLFHGLTLAGFRVQTRDATTVVRPPADAVLIVAGPTGPLGTGDIKLLDEHLQDGGSALVLADDRAPDDLASWLNRRGVIFGGLPTALPDPRQPTTNPRRILVSLRNHIAGQEATFPHHNLAVGLDQVNPQHEVTAPLAASGLSLFSPWTSPVYVLSPRDVGEAAAKELIARFAEVGIDKPFTAAPLFTTIAKDAWDKSRAAALEAPGDLEKRPSVPLAWAIEYQPHAESVRAKVGARLVVWGSRQAASDQVLAQLQYGNDQLLRSAATWLARRATPTNIPTADVRRFQVTATDTTLTILLGVLIAVVPLVFLGGAMLTWWDRR